MKKQVNELSLERAKALLGNKEIKEEKLKKMLERIKTFCKVAYQLYLKRTNPDKPTEEIRQFKSEPPDEFTKAA
jgi:hypothetical protein